MDRPVIGAASLMREPNVPTLEFPEDGSGIEMVHASARIDTVDKDGEVNGSVPRTVTAFHKNDVAGYMKAGYVIP